MFLYKEPQGQKINRYGLANSPLNDKLMDELDEKGYYDGMDEEFYESLLVKRHVNKSFIETRKHYYWRRADNSVKEYKEYVK